VVLFTRAGCHLCDEAWELLEGMRDRYGLELQAQDVDADPAWVRDYGERVPVVVVNGKVRCWGRIQRVLLRRMFEADS
jgi:glutaredoxin